MIQNKASTYINSERTKCTDTVLKSDTNNVLVNSSKNGYICPAFLTKKQLYCNSHNFTSDFI